MTRLTTARSLKATLAIGVLTMLTLTTRGDAAATPIIVVNPTPTDCYGASGCLDATFGTAGKATMDFGGTYQYAYASTVQPDGKTLVAGQVTYDSVSPVTWTRILARFATNGALDSSFGTGGVVTNPGGWVSGQLRALAVQSDGKILVAGDGYINGNWGTAVARLTSGGSADSTFGSGGRVTVMSGSVYGMNAIKLQPDGKIVVVNFAGVSETVVVRLKANGARDTGFGFLGTQSIPIIQSFGARLAFQANGKIIVGGYTNSTNVGKDFAICRLTSSGSLDSSFGSRGTTKLDFLGYDDSLESIAVAADGSIIAAGNARPMSAAGNSYMAFARFSPNGALSTTFGSSGRVLLDMHPDGSDLANDVAIQSDGKIVFVGKANVPENGFAILGRLTANGALDSSFGTGGITETAFGMHDRLLTLTLANGKITAAGYSLAPQLGTSPNIWLLARYYQ